MFDQLVSSVMERRKLLTAPPETAVTDAAKLMANNNLGAVLVIERDCLIGIFTERDIAFRVVARGLDPATTRLADVMTSSPECIGPDKSFGSALLRMHERGFRHLPVVTEGKLLGIVSARSAMDPALEEYLVEENRRKHYLKKAKARTPRSGS